MSVLNPNQLKMFMTPNEIHAQYQPLDADRHDAWDERVGDYTNRSRSTGGRSNYSVRTAADGRPKEASHYRTEHPETDQQVWDRKLSESQMSKSEYDEEVHGTQRPPEMSEGGTGYPSYHTGHTSTFEARQESWDASRDRSHQGKLDEYYSGGSLYDSVAKEGVQYPLHLGTEVGSSGKPQVAGGHHRLAAAAAINPEQLLPVVHHQGATREARASAESGGYEYR
jgi:hypothetical protein